MAADSAGLQLAGGLSRYTPRTYRSGWQKETTHDRPTDERPEPGPTPPTH